MFLVGNILTKDGSTEIERSGYDGGNGATNDERFGRYRRRLLGQCGCLVPASNGCIYEKDILKQEMQMQTRLIRRAPI